jgi:uncharacterized protein (TIGR02145 family)
MKIKALLSIAMGSLIMAAHAQNPSMTLNFTAQYQGDDIALDSIFIQNLTQGGDTMLYLSDTIFILDITTGFSEPIQLSEKRFDVRQNIPNPFADMTTVSVLIVEKGYLEMTVRNIMGQNIAFYAGTLDAGTHRFTFYPGNDRFYLLSAFFNGETGSIKMISNGSVQPGNVSLEYSGIEQYHPAYKDKSQTGSFVFSLGDQLRFTGYATTPSLNIGNNEIEDSPEENKTYTFNIIEGIRCLGEPSITDIDGNIYNTVLIGNQCWMAENLRTTTYKNSTAIPNVTDDSEWAFLATGAYVWFVNDISWNDSYGALYNWYATVDPSGLCPEGWHVPTQGEWTTLTDFIGGTSSPSGNRLKSCRQINSPLEGECNTSGHPRWNQDNTHYGTNDYGFSGFPGSRRADDGSFPILELGRYGYWWSSTETGPNNAVFRYLHFVNGDFYQGSDFKKKSGLSVRCLRDN